MEQNISCSTALVSNNKFQCLNIPITQVTLNLQFTFWCLTCFMISKCDCSDLKDLARTLALQIAGTGVIYSGYLCHELNAMPALSESCVARFTFDLLLQPLICHKIHIIYCHQSSHERPVKENLMIGSIH